MSHHLTNLTSSIGEGEFWTLHVDTLVMAALTGIISLGFLWWVVRGATSGVPSKGRHSWSLPSNSSIIRSKALFTETGMHL